MTEDHLGVAGRPVQFLEQRRGGVPEVMNLDHAQVVAVADPAERADQVPGVDGPAAAGGEDQAGVLPGPAEGFTAGSLLLLPGEQGGARLGGNGKVAVTCLRLKRAGPKLSAPPELLADAQLACVQVHILPAQAENLAAAHAVQQQENQRR
jgi:hypothetical protein